MEARLRAAGCVFAEDEAALLVRELTGEALETATQARIAGTPLEHVLGWAEVGDRRVAVAPGIFVPRQRSMLLVGVAARLVDTGDVVLDLCCGSGALGACLADRVPGIELHAADVDPAAVVVARRNLIGLGVAYVGDLFDALPSTLRGRIDLCVVNAPYVPTEAIAQMPREARDHEPAHTLDGGPDGLSLHRRVADAALSWLRPGGRVVIETSDRQLPGTLDVFAGAWRVEVAATDHPTAAVVAAAP